MADADTSPSVTEKLGTQDFWKELRDDPARLAAEVCSIDVVRLDQTLQTHAALRAWVNAAYEVARINESRAKWEHTKVRARVMLELSRTDPDTKKPKTVTMLEAEAELNPEVVDVTKQLFEQQEIRGALGAMATALQDRRDMLIQIAAKQRKELDEYQVRGGS